jgi:hypothetical protein
VSGVAKYTSSNLYMWWCVEMVRQVFAPVAAGVLHNPVHTEPAQQAADTSKQIQLINSTANNVDSHLVYV